MFLDKIKKKNIYTYNFDNIHEVLSFGLNFDFWFDWYNTGAPKSFNESIENMMIHVVNNTCNSVNVLILV